MGGSGELRSPQSCHLELDCVFCFKFELGMRFYLQTGVEVHERGLIKK